MEEEWKDIKGYEGYYKVSNLGRIKSLDRYIIRHRFDKDFKVLMKGVMLKISSGKNGYRICHLNKENIETSKLVHRVVAQTFIPKIKNKNIINHKNSIRIDNRVENLEWCSQRENVNHAITKGSMEANAAKKVVMLSRNNEPLLMFDSIVEASKGILGEKNYRKGSTCISNCLSGRSKHAMNYKWQYA